ncbi:TIGR01244 family sulfur transferase [Celeribacter indicus]|nr:TIGR01244 family sulfur transferase [Celeribacter indicus]SDW11953.1 TIGR01244 family protein [Celeribacter indicus]
MDFNRINDRLTVSGQITPEEIAILAEKGFTTIIDNRPDAEIGPEHGSETMAAAAQEAGLAFAYLPIVPGQFTPDLIAEMGRLIDEAEGPVYAYCRSGTRSTTAWALSRAGNLAPEEILKQAAGAGYDLSAIAALLAR